ncbi:MAG: amidohydrolase, partial [Acidobacteriota bacterium]
VEDAADLVVWGGKIVTVAGGDGAAEVEALAVRGDRIVAVGSRAEVEAMVGESTEVVDLAGRLAIPGFVEGHAHFTGIGDAAIQLDLASAGSWEATVTMVRDAAAELDAGEWIRGRGWHQDKWSDAPDRIVDGFPTHDELSAAAPDNPVLLTHASGHAALVNAAAMIAAGIDASTADPDGGDIVRDDSGAATGLLNETAQGLIDAVRGGEGSSSDAEMRRMIRLASDECLSKGVTSFHDAGSPFSTIDQLKAAAAEGDLGVRLWVMAEGSNDELAARLGDYVGDGAPSYKVAVGGIKRYMDGALGSRGAWLLEPYSDDPDTDGLQLSEVDDLRQVAHIALDNNAQLCIHAIGDRANREVLDLFDEVLGTVDDGNARRWRIEHAQHVHPDDVPRFGELGVIASVQTVHCTSDGPWVPERIGDERAEANGYPWSDLLDTGARVINGTDAPVEDVDPLANYFSAVTRQMNDGERFYPDQALTREEALRAMTLDTAYGAFQESILGSLEVGKLADIVVLSQDILTVPDEQLPTTTVEMTIVGGEVAYRIDG